MAYKTDQVRNYLNKKIKGSTVEREYIIEKFGIDRSHVTKILEEFSNKNFKVLEGKPGPPKGTIIATPKPKHRRLAKFLFGKLWKNLKNAGDRSKIITGKYTEDTMTDYRRAKVEKGYDVFSKKHYEGKLYSQLGDEEQRRVRARQEPAERGKSGRLKKEAAEKRIKEFQKNFVKENGRLPSQNEYLKLGNFDFKTIKKAVKKGIIKTLPLNITKGLAQQQLVYKDLVKLAGKESVRNIFRKGES